MTNEMRAPRARHGATRREATVFSHALPENNSRPGRRRGGKRPGQGQGGGGQGGQGGQSGQGRSRQGGQGGGSSGGPSRGGRGPQRGGGGGSGGGGGGGGGSGRGGSGGGGRGGGGARGGPRRNWGDRRGGRGAPAQGPQPKLVSTEAAGLREGVYEATGSGGALRDLARHLVPHAEDPIVPPDLARKHGLRGGETVAGETVAGSRNGTRVVQLVSVTAINEIPIEQWQAPPQLQETTAIDPDDRLHFDTPGGPATMRVVELFAPIGRGQRGLIVAPPRTGKTILLQQMAHGISTNHPDIYMIVLLIDERPEEVTDMRRNVHGEVIASSNDLSVESHVRVARMVIERAKRLAEMGKNIVILLDSITRLARAFNNFIGSSGRTMTGGLDINALQEPKQIFGAARNIEGGGSLTIIATALVDTGSRADEFIFQEFKGTGNMELCLDREMANLRIWPAINLQLSGTRKEEKLLEPDTLEKSFMLRRQLHNMPPPKAMQALLERMEPHKDLESFLASLKA